MPDNKRRTTAWLNVLSGVALCRRVLAILMSAVLLYSLGCSSFEEQRVGQSMNLEAELVTLDGRSVEVEDYRGKILFLNFWATWCGPCRMEMPSMARLYSRLGNRGLSMVALTDEDPETVRAFLEEAPYPFPILLDPDRTLFQRFGVQAVPTTLVLDEDGKILFEHMGAYLWDSPKMLDKFQRMLDGDRDQPVELSE